MANDEFDSNRSQNISECNPSQKSHRMQYEKDESPVSRAKNKQKTTTIALSVVTSLFMCVIAYEIVRENAVKPEPQQTVLEPSRPSLALSKMSRFDHTSLYDLDHDDENYETQQIRSLQEQNKRQARKIQLLKHELQEKLQAMHEIKAGLFKVEGDPRDKAKIADLTGKIDEQSKLVNEYAISLQAIEKEISVLQRKIDHSEISREALAGMVEAQRLRIEDDARKSNQKLEDLVYHTDKEISFLKKNKRELEDSLALIDTAFRQKSENLKKKHQSLNKLQTIYDAKHTEHLALLDAHKESKTALTKQIVDLATNYEWETTHKAILAKNIEDMVDARNSGQHFFDDVLLAELEKREKIVALKQAESHLHKNSLEMDALETEKEFKALLLVWELEMTRASILQRDLDKAIYTHRLKSDTDTEMISRLEVELREQRSLVGETQSRIQNLIAASDHAEDQRKAQISRLMTIHELEMLKARHLAKDRHEQLTSDQTQTISENEQEIKKLRQKVRSLEKDLKNKDLVFAARALEMQNKLDARNTRLAHQQANLEEFVKVVEQKNKRLINLEQTIKKIIAKLDEAKSSQAHLKTANNDNLSHIEELERQLQQSTLHAKLLRDQIALSNGFTLDRNKNTEANTNQL